MCVVSNMGDIGSGMWPPPGNEPVPGKVYPYVPFPHFPPVPAPMPVTLVDYSNITLGPKPFPTKEQFEAFLDLLRASIKFDEITGQKECQSAVKTAWIQSMCDHFGLKSPL
jgi:hypothetical protein